MTQTVTICAAVYESARPYLAAFMDGIIVAARGHEVSVLIVSDGLQNTTSALHRLARNLPLYLWYAPAGSSVAEVRELLLRRACDTGSDVLIFTDCDDVLLPEAIGAHLGALRTADFSYGDQILVGPDGEDLDTSLYDCWSVPSCARDPLDLLDGNFIGFSGCAVWRDVLKAQNPSIPHDVVAVDWWLFTRILLSGRTGSQTERPVVRYRQHEANVVSLLPDPEPKTVLRRCEIARSHYAAFLDWPAAVARLESVERLIQEIVSDAGRTTSMIRSACGHPQRWYADIATMASAYCAEETETSRPPLYRERAE